MSVSTLSESLYDAMLAKASTPLSLIDETNRGHFYEFFHLFNANKKNLDPDVGTGVLTSVVDRLVSLMGTF